MVNNFPMKPKAIHDEMGATFDDYGRMSAKLGLEVPFANAAIATFVLQNYVDPPTEIVKTRTRSRSGRSRTTAWTRTPSTSTSSTCR